MAHEKGGYGQKPPNQGHTNQAKPKGKKGLSSGTMGTGKVSPRASGTMGKHQETGKGEAF